MKKITYEDIKNMTDEEVSELNRELGVQVMKKYAWFMFVKWTLICGSIYLARKFIEAKFPIDEQ